MAECLVTGGAGFIGSHLVESLLARGHRVRVLDDLSTGQISNLSELRGPISFIHGDVRDPGKVLQAVKGTEYVFHLAAFISVPESMRVPRQCYDVNVAGTVNLMNVCRLSGVRQMVLSSTCAVYGDSIALPLKEETETAPLSPYAASKQVAEVYAGLYTRSMGLPVVALRYFNVYGPRQSPDSPYAAAIPIFIDRLLADQRPSIFGDGDQKRDFVFVDDVVRANILAAEAPAAAGRVYNVCTGHEISLIELLQTFAEILPESRAPQFESPRAGDIHRSCGDPTRANQELGFAAGIPLIEGLSQTVESLRQLAPCYA